MTSTPDPNPKPPPTTIVSFAQKVQEADPNYSRGLFRPWIYEFSNGRRFEKDPNVYTD